MKIIDSFLFSELHEKELLRIKLECESELVTEWIGIESKYDFRGNYKGAFLNDVLKEDQFDQFRDRIHVITIEENLFDTVGKEKCEKGYFQVEHASRMSCSEYIFSKYNDEDRVIVSDVDESIDCSRPDRRDLFLKICQSSDKDIDIPSLKYWWNFSNLSAYPKNTPVRTIGSLKNGWNYFRNAGCEVIKTDLILSFEYSYCFPGDGNLKKVSTFSHDRYKPEHLERAWHYNTWHKRDHERLDQAWDFFEIVELNESNSPNFILDNFDRLDTKLINPDYAFARVSELGLKYPHIAEQHGLLGSNRIDRRYHYLRRNK